jgi:molybdopterin converting factor small subunit
MKVTVKTALGILMESEVILDLREGAKVRDAIRLLCERHGEEVENFLLTETGELENDVLVICNKVFVADANDRLSDGDMVFISVIMAGG